MRILYGLTALALAGTGCIVTIAQKPDKAIICFVAALLVFMLWVGRRR